MTRPGPQGSIAAARRLDAADPLSVWRREFALPGSERRPHVYLCGHSLGVMPRRARTLLGQHLDAWAQLGVAGHFAPASDWYSMHRTLTPALARLAGAKAGEVVAMNSLTVNLHLMLVSFYRPRGRRRKIIIEQAAFPSDRYAVQSHIALHGGDPTTDLLELVPDPATGRLAPAALSQLLEQQRGDVALVLLPGVQFLSGERLEIQALTALAHRHGALAGFDLAHAIGNVPLRLHTWDVDFAVWCSYKYLNGGPGAIGGCFVHQRHGACLDRPRLAGWWGHDPERRFLLEQQFVGISGAEGWQLSNPPILSMLPLRASLELFLAAGPAALQARSRRMTSLLLRELSLLGDAITILTPRPAGTRGAQVSIRLRAADATGVATALQARGIVVDTREPDILRMAPVPLYNRYADIARTVRALRALL